MIIKEEKQCMIGKYGNILFLILGMGIVVAISYFNAGGNLGGTDLHDMNIAKGIYLFVVGMIAISAMFLPGISGSTLLLIFGLYVPVITAVKELLHLNFDYLPAVIVFGLGVMTGALTVVKGIKICLERYRSQSVYTIVVGPTTLELPQNAMTLETFHIGAFLAGAAVIVLLQFGQMKKEKNMR